MFVCSVEICLSGEGIRAGGAGLVDKGGEILGKVGEADG